MSTDLPTLFDTFLCCMKWLIVVLQAVFWTMAFLTEF